MGGDLDWMDRAACRGCGPDIWFPYLGEGVATDYGPAKAICAECPVRTECLSYAVACIPIGDNGVWGGADPDELRQLRRQSRRAPRGHVVVRVSPTAVAASVVRAVKRAEARPVPCGFGPCTVAAGVDGFCSDECRRFHANALARVADRQNRDHARLMADRERTG